jgi:hypothetical protein
MTETNPAENLRTIKLIEVLRKQGRWCVVLHFRDKDADSFIQEAYSTKAQAKAAAQAMGRWIAQTQGFPIQVHFKKRNGQIPKGGHGTVTYGHDPKRYAG